MKDRAYRFPTGFLWGTATSAHQVEGNNTQNNWWAWEQEPGRILQGHRSGRACDWWAGRWREDFDRAAEAGQNAHRLSVEWSRIQPAPDRWDEGALEVYREMLQGLRARHMVPMVTLHHFTDPLWFAERGGWEREDAPQLFAAFVEKVVEGLGDLVSLWCTINEPNVLAYMAYLEGTFPPGEHSLRKALRVMVHLLRAHAAAYRVLHRRQPHARVGMAIHYRGFVPARPHSRWDRWVARMLSRLFNDFFPYAAQTGVLLFPWGRRREPELQGTQDFVGVNYYTQDRVQFDVRAVDAFFARRFYPPDADLSDHGFIANEPEGMYRALHWAYAFGVPVFVTENGVEDADDDLRPRYLAQHVHQVWRAVQEGLPVQGYFHWTLVDNFEWDRGWTQRFGLWALDVDTQERRKRPSADFYAAICRSNALRYEDVARYCPEVLHRVFPQASTVG